MSDILRKYLLGECPHMPGGFQSQVNVQPAPATWGDFADSNPRFVLNAGPGGFVAGANGVTVGRFCWTAPPVDPDGTNQVVTSGFSISGQTPGTASASLALGVSNAPAGFVGRPGLQALITTYLADSSMVIPQGFPVVVYNGGGFWAKNEGTTFAQVGMKAYALFSNGGVVFAASGGTPSTATVTGSSGPQTMVFNGTIAGDILTVISVTSGANIVPGTIITGGTGIITGTMVVSQISGTTYGAGTYLLNYPEQTVSSPTFTGTYTLLNVASVQAGTLAVGDVISGSGVTSGSIITGLGTGVGLTGTYYVSPSYSAVAANLVTTVNAYETKWYAMSTGLPGELVKISDHYVG